MGGSISRSCEREASRRAWRDDREASSAVVNEGDAAKQGPLCGGALSYNAGALGGDTAAARPREGGGGGRFPLGCNCLRKIHGRPPDENIKVAEHKN